MAIRSDVPTQLRQELKPNSLAEIIRKSKGAITAQQLAEVLACSVKLIHAMVKQNRLPAIRIGSMIRFDPQITADWIEAHQL